MSAFPEPTITVNGMRLTEAQAMTVRVALGIFVDEMERQGVGQDETGQALAAAYSARGREVLTLMLEGQP